MLNIRIITLAASLLVAVTSMSQVMIVNDASTVVNVKDRTTATQTEMRRFTITSERGKSMASTLIICSPYEKLTRFEGTAIDAQGNVIHKFKKNELKKTELSDNFATDDYSMILDYTPPCYPITITWEWQIEMSGGWVTFPSFIPYPYRSREIKVEHASYKISMPQTMECSYKTLNFNGNVSENKDEKGCKVYNVEVSNLEYDDEDTYSAPLSEQTPRVYFASPTFEFRGVSGKRNSWEEFGTWIYNLASKDFKFTPDFEQQIRAMTDTCSSDNSKIAVLYKYLEKTTRYVSIQLGIGGLKPLPVEYTRKTGFGDCKGLSNYMRAMLDVVGIKSHFTIISTENKRLTPDFASANQCNHAILCVPQAKDTIWLECTSPTLPLGYVHEDIAGHDALIVTPDGGKLVTLPQYADSLNRQSSKLTIKLSPDGLASMNLEQQSTWRQYEDKKPLRYLEEKKFREMLLGLIYAPSASFKSSSIVEEKEPFSIPCMTIKAELENLHYGNVTGNRIFLPANPMHKNYHAIKKDENRKQDITISYGYVDEEEIDIIIPDGYEMENKPEASVISEPFGSLVWAIVQDGNTIKVMSRFERKSGKWDASQYQKIYDFEKAIEQRYNQRIVLKKTE